MFRIATKREKALTLFTASVAALALVYSFVIEPIAGKWAALDKKITDKENTLQRHSRILREKDNINKLRAQYAKYFGRGRLTPEEESAAALSVIERIARQSGVRITNIKPISSKLLGNHNVFSFRVAAESGIAELAKFIYDVQSSEQLLRVDRMVLTAKEGEPSTIKSILNVSKLSVF